MTQSADEQKKQLRKRMRALRLVADQKEGPDAAAAIARNLLAACDQLGIVGGTVVAGYWPIVTEIDVRPLLARLHERGVVCALPCLAGREAPLLFRRWIPSEQLEAADLGTWQPAATAPGVTPDVVLLPLLAVDRQGYRLGQGVGYYDRTLAALRREREIVTVGVGYAVQRRDHVPHDDVDEPVDWILTSEGLERAQR